MLIASLKNAPTKIPDSVDALELRLDLNPDLRVPEWDKVLIAKGKYLESATYIDYDWREKPEREHGIICSRHIDHTPKDLIACFNEMQETKADIYKLATMAHSTLDALRMLIAVRQLGPKFVGLCMGEFGQITRILSPHTYAHLGEPTAPGQLSVDELTNIYRYPRREEKWYGLIGDPVEQSPSHVTHNRHCLFLKMRVSKEELPEFFRLTEQLPFAGLAVTTPHKESITDHPINTMVRTPSGWETHNTDGLGVQDVLGNVKDKRIALLGAGGTAKAILATLSGAEITVYNRTPKTNTYPLTNLKPYDILINATTCGMLSDDCPIESVQPNTTVFETICSPEETTLIKRAKARGCHIHYGKELFHAQAARQFNIWFA